MSAAAPGPSSSVTWRASPRTTTAGSREALSRTRSAAAAASSATAIAVARSSRPRGSRRPRQSSSGGQPGDADGHVALPVAPGAAEGVGDDHGGAARAAAARSARALASGSRGRSDERAVLGGVGGVDARVGAHEAVMGAADEHAALRAHDRRGLVEDDLHVARVLGVLARELARALAGDRRRSSAPQRALGLGDDLVGDHEHVAGLVAAGAAAARRGRRPGAPRAGRPAPTPRRSGPGSPLAAACLTREGAVEPRQQSARVRRAAGARVERGAQRPRGRRRCRRRAPASAARPRASARRLARGRLLVALAAARAEARARSRRAARAAARWCRCRGGRGR